ncbi:hypothetical protein BLL52_1070 [Rhodoferax antarcticus ANT.BR]|uniref:Uncharacterized protein n=1 Tax=Rhodoferax antarcticus ANT.BR TaxID=1111071 RepID=A0A1Q8YIY4_9BURK|nr:hypothetical protein BLL52_1070 [Rhodoferax antarcticus ANT.BR]
MGAGSGPNNGASVVCSENSADAPKHRLLRGVADTVHNATSETP